MTTEPEVPAWLVWPLRAIAVVVVLPLRLAREALGLIRRALARFWQHAVVEPVAWLWRYAIAIPLAWAWRYLINIPFAWAWRYLIAIPLAWVWRYLITIPLAWPWRHVIVAPLARVWTILLVPLGRLARAILRGAGLPLQGAIAALRWAGRLVGRWAIRPVADAVAWLWRAGARLLRPVRTALQSLCLSAYVCFWKPIGRYAAATSRATAHAARMTRRQ